MGYAEKIASVWGKVVADTSGYAKENTWTIHL